MEICSTVDAEFDSSILRVTVLSVVELIVVELDWDLFFLDFFVFFCDTTDCFITLSTE